MAERVDGFRQTARTTSSRVNATLVAPGARTRRCAALTEASYAQNEEVKKISAWAAILFAPTLVGTIYGMNFDHMPELHWASATRSRSALMLSVSACCCT